MELRAGDIVQRRYEILRDLGRGGLATTYLARDRLGDREVALKLLRTSSAQHAQLLREEFGRLCGLFHPSLCRVHDLGTDLRPGGARHFYTADVVDGVTLEDFVPGRSWPDIAPALGDGIAALAFLHQLSICHGDFKPANILVDRQGRGVLIDLGCARSFGPTADREVSGTAGFLAPELLAGERCDGRADLFAVGVTLGQILEEVEAPAQVQRLVQRLTRPQPQRRAATAEEVLEALDLTDFALAPPTGSVPHLIGRQREMKTFGALLERLLAREPGPRALWVSGPAGLGRTRLLREMKWAAQLRCLALEGVVSGARPVVQLLRLAVGEEALGEGVPGVLEARERLVSSGRPLVLVLDDVHLLPDEEEQVLHALLRTLEPGDPFILLCSSLEAGLISGPTIEQLRLEPLGQVEVQRWAQHLALLPARHGPRLLELSGGYPAYLEAFSSLLRRKEFHGEDVESLSACLVGETIRLGGVDEETSHALGLVAALDGVLEEEERELYQVTQGALLRLRRDGWLRRDGTAWKLLRRADGKRILEALPPERVRQVHLAVAGRLAARLQGLEGGGEVERSRLEARLAAHLLEGGKVAEATGVLTQNGRLVGLAPAAWCAVGEALVERSLDPEVLLTTVEVDRLSGRAERALRTLARLLLSPDDQVVPARLWCEAAACHVSLGRPRRAQRQLEQAFDQAASDQARAELADTLSRVLRQQGEYHQAMVRARGSLEQTNDPAARAALHEDIGVAASYLGHDGTATRHLAEAMRLQSGSPRAEYRVQSYRAIHEFRAGRLEQAIQGYRAALEFAEQHHLSDLIANAALNLGTALQQRGDWGSALASYERGLPIAVALGKTGTQNTLRFNIANLLVDIGLFERAEPAVHRVRREAREAGAAYLEVSTAILLGEIALARGELAQALEWFEQARGAGDAQGTPREQAEVELHRAEVALTRGETDRASRLLQSARAHGAEAKATDLEARLLAGQGGLEMACGQGALGLQTLEEARLLAGQTGHRALQAEIETRLAEAYDRQQAHTLAQASRLRARGLWERVASSLPEPLRDAFWAHRRRAGVQAPGGAERNLCSRADLRRFLEVNRRINSTLAVGAVLEYAMDAAIELTGAERGFLLLLGEAGGSAFEVPAARNIDRKHIGTPHHEFSRTIAVEVVRTGEPVVTTDAALDERFKGQPSIHQRRLRSVVCVPIRSPEGTLGALYLDHRNRDQFAAEDSELLVAFGDQVALALHNARLLSRLEEQAQQLRDRARALEEANARVEALLRGREEEIERLNEEVRARQQALELRYDYSNIIFRGPAMRSVLATVDRVVDRRVSVLVHGESGTGKELVARAIHFNSPRRGRPFLGVNCAALPESLLESELFGHVRGAFTGAERDREGLLVSASGGTLFLDELGEMPLSMQAKLLRALQEQEVTPLGASRPRSVDIRLVCATNRPLLEAVEAGRFREDLYYRVAVVDIRLPPLRERVEDIPVLAQHILGRLAAESGRPLPRLNQDVVPALIRQPWPGNVRQLQNVLTRAYVMARRNRLKASDLELHRVPSRKLPSDREQFEREEARRILAALNANRWNVRAVSRALGIPSNTLYRKLKRYNIQRPT